jgi:hypothetical protein
MDLLLIFVWLIAGIGFLIGIFSSAYYVYVRGANGFALISKIVFALIVYGLATPATGALAGFVLFIGAHSGGPVVNTRESLLGFGIVICYAQLDGSYAHLLLASCF